MTKLSSQDQTSVLLKGTWRPPPSQSIKLSYIGLDAQFGEEAQSATAGGIQNHVRSDTLVASHHWKPPGQRAIDLKSSLYVTRTRNLKAERSRQWELGVNGIFKNVLTARDTARFKLAWFDNKVRDYVTMARIMSPIDTESSGVSGPYAYVNLDGPFHSRGIELQSDIDTGTGTAFAMLNFTRMLMDTGGGGYDPFPLGSLTGSPSNSLGHSGGDANIWYVLPPRRNASLSGGVRLAVNNVFDINYAETQGGSYFVGSGSAEHPAHLFEASMPRLSLHRPTHIVSLLLSTSVATATAVGLACLSSPTAAQAQVNQAKFTSLVSLRPAGDDVTTPDGTVGWPGARYPTSPPLYAVRPGTTRGWLFGGFMGGGPLADRTTQYAAFGLYNMSASVSVAENATSCTASGDNGSTWSGTQQASGNQVQINTALSKVGVNTFTLRCENSASELATEQTVSVNVAASTTTGGSGGGGGGAVGWGGLLAGLSLWAFQSRRRANGRSA
ncbi:MAG: hypothetical protein WAQ08_00810 [Aquabacterium sp.]|uniref:hypothetical protein n=1 Tax=Aquabacterium sp. TaxID=1872578 RepID=UPI003BAE5DF0